nr:hypothetical protein BdHM001_13430 [Bdellovibrio sp. HM001]
MGLVQKRYLNLKQVCRLLFTGVLGLSLTATATDKGPNLNTNNITSADKIALTLISKLPNSGVKSGLQRYYSILSLKSYTDDAEVAVANTGLALFFEQHFNQNKCFAENAYKFYRDLRQNTRQQQAAFTDGSRHRRPSLGDVAGKNRPDLKPGWLYEKALKYANGNPNAAISLIGMCGHDDKNQGHFVNQDVEIQLQNSGLRSDELYTTTEDSEDQTVCPSQYADFYVAGGLSKTSDIADDLKKKILSIQYPGKKAVQIAAKNYHVMGAAFMTCQMIEAGLNPLLAIQVESMAANLYRGIRLCQNIEIPGNLFWDLQRHREVAFRPFGKTFEEIVLEKAMDRAHNKKCTIKDTRTDALCRLLKVVGVPQDISRPQMAKRAQDLLTNYMDEMIASGLYASWHISGEVAGISLPCSQAQLWGPHPFMQWLISNTEVRVNICGNGLTMEACRKAVKKIRSWEVDFDWTVSQHVAGARFAAKVCKPYPEGRSSFEAFCNR